MTTSERESPASYAVGREASAGCSATGFTARYGLETVAFDRDCSSIQRCAYLECDFGYPAGIDIETLSDLLHERVNEAGSSVVADLVERAREIRSGAVGASD